MFLFFFPDVFGCNFSFSFSKTEMKKSHDIFILVSMALFWSKSMDDGKSDSISWMNPIDQSAFIIRSLSFLLYSSRKVLYWTSSRPPYSKSTIKQMHTVFKKTLNLTICLYKKQKQKERERTSSKCFKIDGDWWIQFNDDKRRWNEYDDNINSAISFTPLEP